MQKVKTQKRVRYRLHQASPTILTIIASVGVVTTTIMAVRATPKAIKMLKEAETEKGENLTKLEIIRAVGPIYIPSVLLGASTIACIFGANALNQKKQASLMSAYAMLNESYKQYRKAAKTKRSPNKGSSVIDQNNFFNNICYFFNQVCSDNDCSFIIFKIL